MIKYDATFILPYKLGEYEIERLRSLFERELQTSLDDRSIRLILTEHEVNHG